MATQDLCIPDQTVAKWNSMLFHHRRYLIFLWRSLSFSTSPLCAVLVWAPVHLTIGVLFSGTTTLLVLVGNCLLMVSFFYGLVRFAVQFTGPAEWTTAQEEQYHVICHHLAYLEVVIRYTTNQFLQWRKTDPWKFYLGWLTLSLVVTEIGRWISIGLAVQLFASVVLLIPVAMERDWLASGSNEHVVPALQTFRETLTTLARHYWHLAKSKFNRYRARRQRNKTS